MAELPCIGPWKTIAVRPATYAEKGFFWTREATIEAILRHNGELPAKGSKLPRRLRKFLPADAEALFA